MQGHATDPEECKRVPNFHFLYGGYHECVLLPKSDCHSRPTSANISAELRHERATEAGDYAQREHYQPLTSEKNPTPIAAALLIEPRPLKTEHDVQLVISSVRNVRQVLGPSVPIVWFHGNEPKSVAHQVQQNVTNLILRSLPLSNLPWPFGISSFYLQPALWEEMTQHGPGSHSLVFQLDSGFCDPFHNHTSQLEQLQGSDYLWFGSSVWSKLSRVFSSRWDQFEEQSSHA
jgi:hypothetical protein